MGVSIIDNFQYKGKKGNFDRDSFSTFKEMRDYEETGIDEGHICYCDEDGNHYEFRSTNTVDEETGRWRLYNKSVNTLDEDGEGKVLDARQGKTLKDLIDAKVIEAGGVPFDTTPTEGSSHPVTSDGIYKSISKFVIWRDPSEIEDVPGGVDDDPGTVSPSIPTILLSELDALIQPGLSNSQDNYYKVLDYENGHVVGVLMVFSDNMGHVITQVFTTHYDNPGTWDSHRDDEIYVYYRSYKVGGTLDIPQFSWTDWKKLSNSGQIVIPFATSEVYGTVKLGSDIEQSIAAQEPQSVAARTYPVQKDKDGKLVVNVPWTGDGATPMLVFDGIVSGDIIVKSSSTLNNDGIYWAEDKGQFVCKDGDEYYLGWAVDDRYKGLPIDYANCSLFVQSPRTAVSIGAQVHAIYAKVAKKQPTSDYKTVLEKVGEIYANATPSSDGLMSKEDKVKLDSALTGDGVSSVKVVTEMPEEQESNVLYIVTGEE